MQIDELSLAAAIIGHADVSRGEAALDLAADVLLRLGTPALGMTADATAERAAAPSGLDGRLASRGAEP